MKKEALLRGLLGFPLGITIGYIITIIISLIFADGNFYPCHPALINEVGSEIGAVVLQTILSGILGATFAATSVIFKNDNWNIVKQTVIHFCITSPIFLTIAYTLQWMERSFWGFIRYFVVMIIIYIITWLIAYIVLRHKLKSINKKLSENREI